MAALKQLGEEGSWNSYRRLVLSELERLDERDNFLASKLDKKLEKIITMQEKLQMNVASLQAKSGIWGMLGGLVPVVVALAMLLIGKYAFP